MTKTTYQSSVLPMDKKLERAVPGTTLSSNRLLEQVDGLQPDHFTVSFHRKMFSIIIKLVTDGDVADVNTIRHCFSNPRDIEVFDGTIGMSLPQYIDEMPNHAASRENLKTYVKTIRDLYMCRMVIGFCEDLMPATQDPPPPTTRSPSRTWSGWRCTF